MLVRIGIRQGRPRDLFCTTDTYICSRIGYSYVFVLAYFRNEDEALHYAVSEDGYDWEPLNGGEAVLWSDVGNESIRDPFLIQDNAGTYHLLGTDGWDSDGIVYANSPDLVDWSDPELVGVMEDIPGARNVWAPECFYDRDCELYRLLWSSTVSLAEDSDISDDRIWTCSTTDFETFSAPSVIFDPGYRLIDACVVYDDDEYLMAFRASLENENSSAQYKIKLARAPSGGGPFEDVTEPVTPGPVEGPTLLHNGKEWLMLYDHFVEGRYGASRSDDAHSWEVCDDKITVPAEVRHADVIEVGDSVVDRLRAEF